MSTMTAILGARVKTVINSTDFSGDFNQARLNFTQTEIDVTVFGNLAWARKIVGISSGAIDFTGFGQTSGHTLDTQLWAMLGAPATATSWEIDFPDTNVGSLRYTGNAYLKSYNSDLKPTDAYKISASLSITGAPTRALISS